MRSKGSNSGQDIGPGEQQKRSVFDRLGRQLDTGRAMGQRSPYIDHMQPPPPNMPLMNEADPRARYARDAHLQEVDWRYSAHERRQLLPSRERHPSQMACGHIQQQPALLASHYDMDMPGDRPPMYYPAPHPYASNPACPPGPVPGSMMAPGMPMTMHQRRPSPKYDRHGNLIRSSPMQMEPHPGMSPPRNFMPMMQPSGPFEMPMLRPGEMYPDQRWHEPLEVGPHGHRPVARMLPGEHFMDSQRYQQPPVQQENLLLNQQNLGPNHPFGHPRYAKWRERRDVITNLDRETAQSSSRTDSLKSSLLHDHKFSLNKDSENAKLSKRGGPPSTAQSETTSKANKAQTEPTTTKTTTKKAEESKRVPATDRDPQDISDGEIIDDEDSSDDSDLDKPELSKSLESSESRNHQPLRQYQPRGHENVQYFEAAKRRRLHDRDDYLMDYETISDEELDFFMSEKKHSDSKVIGDDQAITESKNSSEIELLNALGLDWANLVEMSKQSKKEVSSSGSALRRFAPSNYLPTLGISKDLAGPEIYDLMLKICQSPKV